MSDGHVCERLICIRIFQAPNVSITSVLTLASSTMVGGDGAAFLQERRAKLARCRCAISRGRFRHQVRPYAVVICMVEYNTEHILISNYLEATLYNIDIRSTRFNNEDR
jgi:hypothetical protein